MLSFKHTVGFHGRCKSKNRTWGLASSGAMLAPVVVWAAHEGDLQGEALSSRLLVDQADGWQPDIIVQAIEAQREGLQVVRLTPADVRCSMAGFRGSSALL